MRPEPRSYICYNAKCRWAHTPRQVEPTKIENGGYGMWFWPHPFCECSPEMEMRRWYGPPQAELVVRGDELIFDTFEAQQAVGGQ